MSKRIWIFTVLFVIGFGRSNAQRNRDSCIARLKIYTDTPVDSSTNLVSKRVVGNFMDRINDCLTDKYTYQLEDRAFEILAPVYLTKRSYEFGKHSFWYSLLDTSFMYATLRKIEIHFDFIGGERKLFQERVNRGENKVEWRVVEGKKVQLYKSTDGLYNGRLELDNNTFIMFSTGNQSYEEELLRSILSFKWR
jgi:hypothetical protein